jgi:hypothetical protein
MVEPEVKPDWKGKLASNTIELCLLESRSRAAEACGSRGATGASTRAKENGMPRRTGPPPDPRASLLAAWRTNNRVTAQLVERLPGAAVEGRDPRGTEAHDPRHPESRCGRAAGRRLLRTPAAWAGGRVRRALGISVHTGWAACVVVGGSLRKPEIAANESIDILGEAERFCFHMAAEMDRKAAGTWILKARAKALASARRALEPLIARDVGACAIVAKRGDPGELDEILAAHPRIHLAEGCFYRDVLRDACTVPVHVVPPSELDVSAVGKLSAPPWGRDQKLAALAAWSVMGRGAPSRTGG